MTMRHVFLTLVLMLAATATAAQPQYKMRPGDTLTIEVLPPVFVSIQPREEPCAVATGAPLAAGSALSIYFLGEVNRPGLVEVKLRTTLLQAMAIGGGVTRFAATKHVQLRHTGPRTGAQSVFQTQL